MRTRKRESTKTRKGRLSLAVIVCGAALAIVGCRGPHGLSSVQKPAEAGTVRQSRAAATPVVPAGDRLRGLRKRLEVEAKRVPGRAAAIYWEDLETGQSVAIQPSKVFRSASLIKIPVAAATLSLWEHQPELRTPEREKLLWKMIAESDNAAVDVLAEMVGGLPAVNQFCREQGWRDTRMNYYFRDWRTRKGHNLTSARDVAAMLRAIDRGRLVNAGVSASIWQMLRDQTMRQRIPAGIPEGSSVEVGNKTGTLLTVLHDAAIVRSPNARYLLCILTASPRSEPAGDAYCRRVSRVVWDRVHGVGR